MSTYPSGSLSWKILYIICEIPSRDLAYKYFSGNQGSRVSWGFIANESFKFLNIIRIRMHVVFLRICYKRSDPSARRLGSLEGVGVRLDLKSQVSVGIWMLNYTSCPGFLFLQNSVAAGRTVFVYKLLNESVQEKPLIVKWQLQFCCSAVGDMLVDWLDDSCEIRSILFNGAAVTYQSTSAIRAYFTPQWRQFLHFQKIH